MFNALYSNLRYTQNLLVSSYILAIETWLLEFLQLLQYHRHNEWAVGLIAASHMEQENLAESLSRLKGHGIEFADVKHKWSIDSKLMLHPDIHEHSKITAFSQFFSTRRYFFGFWHHFYLLNVSFKSNIFLKK